MSNEIRFDHVLGATRALLVKDVAGTAYYWVTGNTWTPTFGSATVLTLTNGTFAGQSMDMVDFPTGITVAVDAYAFPYSGAPVQGQELTSGGFFLPWTGAAIGGAGSVIVAATATGTADSQDVPWVNLHARGGRAHAVSITMLAADGSPDGSAFGHACTFELGNYNNTILFTESVTVASTDENVWTFTATAAHLTSNQGEVWPYSIYDSVDNRELVKGALDITSGFST